jgi:hypothetical protein
MLADDCRLATPATVRVLDSVALPVTAIVLEKVALPVTAIVFEKVALPVTVMTLENVALPVTVSLAESAALPPIDSVPGDDTLAREKIAFTLLLPKVIVFVFATKPLAAPMGPML